MQILQRTPLGVLHRRSLLTRPRRIHRLVTTYINPHYFLMDLITTAGTYVKEVNLPLFLTDFSLFCPNFGLLLAYFSLSLFMAISAVLHRI